MPIPSDKIHRDLYALSEFPCTRCGACCRNVHLAQETQTLDRGDGSCLHYDDESKLCRIYANRPAVCRIDEHYLGHYQSTMSWAGFIEINLQACEKLKAL